MTNSWLGLALTAIVLVCLQLAASYPWRWAINPSGRGRLRFKKILITEFALATVGGLLLGSWLYANTDARTLGNAGRVFQAILQLQLGADFFVFAFALMLRFWPKGGAVALAAYLEGLREPKFWFLFVVAAVLMGVAPFVPYFTFGEDLKMMKEICYAFVMFAPAIYGVLTGTISVSEEIEGRTAVTLMSKPISRRQFLLGKFLGILLTCLTMTLLLGWFLVWLILYKTFLEVNTPALGLDIPDAAWPAQEAAKIFGRSPLAEILRGIFLWINDSAETMPGLIMGFCQVMIITASAVALATRLPMVVNLVVCLVIYFLGNLTANITVVTATGNKLVHFMAQLFYLLLPGLDNFDIDSAIVRDAPLPAFEYSVYTFHVLVYGLMYTAIALLVGLILFEDRDLA